MTRPRVSKKRSVLITGGSGFIATHCLQSLQSAFHEVHLITHRSSFNTEYAFVHRLDLLESKGIKKLLSNVKPSHLLHLAWDVSKFDYLTSPTNKLWYEASIKLLKNFVALGGKRIVTVGTSAEYAPGTIPYNEAHSPVSNDLPYAFYKQKLTQVLAAEGYNYAHARLFQVFGPGESAKRIVPSLITAMIEGKEAHCKYGDHIRDFVYVKDVAEALVKLLVSEVQGNVNIASGRPVRLRDLVDLIRREIKSQMPVYFDTVSTPSVLPDYLVADVKRLYQELQFNPIYTLEEGIRETIDWIKQNNASSYVCPVCSNAETKQFLTRSNVPANQNLTFKSQEDAEAARTGTLLMRHCGKCDFLFNSNFDESLISYDSNYNNTQTFSPIFQRYMLELTSLMIDSLDIRNKRILEIGCGKRGIVRDLVESPNAHNVGWGYDTSYEGKLELLDGRLKYLRQYYSAENHVPADVIICRHVIEHVAKPTQFLESIVEAIIASGVPHGKLFFETPDAEWLIRNKVIWDIFYEHCSLFNQSSLETLFINAGFSIERCRKVFENQYLWLEANWDTRNLRVPFSDKSNHLRKGSSIFERLLQNYVTSEKNTLKHWHQTLEHLATNGGIAVWGAGAKGVTFANLADPNRKNIQCFIDVNPGKQGGFLPKTGHPIVAPTSLVNFNVSNILVLNPVYFNEISEAVKFLKLQTTVIDLSSFEILKRTA